MAAPVVNAFNTNGQQFNSSSAVAKYFKLRYSQKDLENVFAFGKPTLERLGSWKQDLASEGLVIPVQTGTQQGLGSSVKFAIDNANTTTLQRWVLTSGGLYGHVSIDAKTMMSSKEKVAAFLPVKEKEWTDSISMGGQELEKQLWQTGTGSEGTLTADPGTGQIGTMSTSNIINIQKGLRFFVYADSSGVPGTVRAGGPYVVDTVNYQAGTFTTTAAFDAAAASGDHVVRAGSVPISGQNQLLAGIPAWIPTADPSATLFFGVDRTQATQVLSGWRGTWKGSIEETFKTLDAQMRRLNRRSVELWLSFANYNRFEIELGARAIRMADGGKATAGFQPLAFTSGGKLINVRCAPYVPETHGWLLDMSGFSLHSIGAVPHVIMDDGMQWYRIRGGNTSSNAEDGIAAEWRAWPQLFCDEPFNQGVAPIS